MSDALEQVLKLVAEGRLTAEEAAPILAALDARPTSGATRVSGEGAGGSSSAGSPGTPRYARVEIGERGRKVVDLRVPISLGRLALGRVPGISSEHVANLEAAIAAGSFGPILDIRDEDGGSVRIVLE